MLGVNPYKKGTFGHRDKHREREREREDNMKKHREKTAM